MNAASLPGKLRHLLTASPMLWPEFFRQWRMRHTSGVIPCILPSSRRIIQIPATDYHDSYWYFCESRDGRQELKFFCDRLRAGDVFFDIGSFRGVYAAAAKATHGSKVYVVAFEPVKRNADAIRRISERNRFEAFELVETALGDGTLLAAELDPESEMIRSHGATHGAVATPIGSISLDEFCAEKGVNPDILKLDVDGFELKVLQGAARCLKEHRPRIWLEIHPEFLAAQGTSADAVLDLLGAQNYRLHEFHDVRSEYARIAYHIWAEPAEK